MVKLKHRSYRSNRTYIPLITAILSFTFPFSLNLIQQLIDAFAFFFNAIADEMNLGRARKIQRKSQLLTHERRGMLQRRERRFVLVLVTGYGHVNTGGALVRRKPNVRNRDHRQSWIFQLVTDNLSNL